MDGDLIDRLYESTYLAVLNDINQSIENSDLNLLTHHVACLEAVLLIIKEFTKEAAA